MVCTIALLFMAYAQSATLVLSYNPATDMHDVEQFLIVANFCSPTLLYCGV
jgi:hypothetical protein